MDNINTKHLSRKKKEKKKEEKKNKNNLNYELKSYYNLKKKMHQKFYLYNNPYNLCKKHVEKTPDAFC